jgi:N4-gp56 family major capsid protein
VAFTQLSSVTWDQAAYQLLSHQALRSRVIYDTFASIDGSPQDKPGTSVIFNFTADLATATTPLTETSDVTPVAMSDSQVTVTLNEYGNAVETTAKLRGTSYIPVNPRVANVIGYNAADSLDALAKAQLQAGSNVDYPGAVASRVTVAAGTTITAAEVAKQVALLRDRNAIEMDGTHFAAIIHPLVGYDLRQETGTAAWSDPVAYTTPERRWNAEIGAFNGARFMETNRAPEFVDAGVGGTVDVYATLFLGQESLAKVFSTAVSKPTPQVVYGPQTDYLRRFDAMGWYWLGGYGRFREDCIQRLESSSSIGAN